MTSLQSFTIKNPYLRSPIDVAKQRAAFPPNFVHSLDATHMLRTALACARLPTPITFAAVHDSYWTHACDTDQLRDILKEEFIHLHKEPILENLRNEFMKRYGGRKCENVYTVDEYMHRFRGMDGKVLENMVEDIDGVVMEKKHGVPSLEESGLNESTTKETADAMSSSPAADTNDTVHSVADEDPTTHIPATDSSMANITDIEDEIEVMDDETGVSDDMAGDGTEKQDDAVTVKIRQNQKYVRLWEDFQLPPTPKRGEFDVRKVMQSEYFFS
jgi:DNA-directed RNA polymerase